MCWFYVKKLHICTYHRHSISGDQPHSETPNPPLLTPKVKILEPSLYADADRRTHHSVYSNLTMLLVNKCGGPRGRFTRSELTGGGETDMPHD